MRGVSGGSHTKEKFKARDRKKKNEAGRNGSFETEYGRSSGGKGGKAEWAKGVNVKWTL